MDDQIRIGAQGQRVRLRLLATTDLHMHLLPYDYSAGQWRSDIGLARTAALIHRLRAEVPLCLLLDNGDFLQGNPMGDYLVGLPRDGRPHPAIAAMNVLGYDAATLGNHDFNYGLDYLLTTLSQARFPHVCSNLTLVDSPPGLHRQLILTREVAMPDGRRLPLRIGLMGLLPPQTVEWDRAHLDGVATVADICEAAAATGAALRAAGADLVIALCHSGLGEPAPVARMEHAAAALPLVARLDAIIAGHSHLVFPAPPSHAGPAVDPVAGTVHGVPTVLPGYRGSHLGVIDLDLSHSPETGWQVTGHQTRALAVVETETPDPAVVAAAEAAHRATLDHIARPVGHTTRPLTTYFAMVAPEPALGLIAEAHRWHIRALLRETAFDDLPVLAAVAPFKAGGRGGPQNYTCVPAGPMTLRAVHDLYTYPNQLEAVAITGAELCEWLERSAAAFCQISPDQADQPLLNPDFPAYEFDVLDGVSYSFDLTQPPRYDSAGRLRDEQARRLAHLHHDGRPVTPHDRFIVATSDYRASTRGFDDSQRVATATGSAREVLRRYIETQGSVTPTLADWTLRPIAGASVLFDTGPAAIDYMPRLPGMRVESAGSAPGGFARFRIAF